MKAKNIKEMGIIESDGTTHQDGNSFSWDDSDVWVNRMELKSLIKNRIKELEKEESVLYDKVINRMKKALMNYRIGMELPTVTNYEKERVIAINTEIGALKRLLGES